jgi:hypothetical protein
MYRIFYLILFIFFECILVSCATSRTNISQEVTSQNQCRLVISFISKGGGIDRNTKNKVLAYLESYNKTHGKSILYETIRWGREGEVDFCFSLSELKKKEQNKFIQELKSLVGNSENVRIAENTEKRKGLSIK